MYKYQEQKAKIFTEEGSVMFTKIRDHVKTILRQSGAITMEAAISVTGGDSWMQMACVDRLVETGEVKELVIVGHTPGQYRVFVPAIR